jgi:hypothetical protein
MLPRQSLEAPAALKVMLDDIGNIDRQLSGAVPEGHDGDRDGIAHTGGDFNLERRVHPRTQQQQYQRRRSAAATLCAEKRRISV